MKDYDTYGPKAFAGLENLADALADRSFHIVMKRATKRMPRLNIRRLKVMTEGLRHQISLWVDHNLEELEKIYDAQPDELPQLRGFDDRFQDISEPPVVLAMAADVERPEEPSILKELLDALQHCAGQREVSAREQNLLAFLELITPRLDSADSIFLPTKEILDLCREHEGLSWFDNGKRLAPFLKHFGLFPKGNGKNRGYDITRAWVEECASRYGFQANEE